MNFEAGALAKRLDTARVIPLAIDIKQSDVKQPLGQFQVIEMTRAGILEVVKLLDGFCSSQLPDVTKACEQWWPQLEAALAAIPRSSDTSAPVRNPTDLLDEILTTVRNLHSRLAEAPMPTQHAVVSPVPHHDDVPAGDPSDPEYEVRLRAATNLRTKIRNRGFLSGASSRVVLEDPPFVWFRADVAPSDQVLREIGRLSTEAGIGVQLICGRAAEKLSYDIGPPIKRRKLPS